MLRAISLLAAVEIPIFPKPSSLPDEVLTMLFGQTFPRLKNLSTVALPKHFVRFVCALLVDIFFRHWPFLSQKS